MLCAAPMVMSQAPTWSEEFNGTGPADPAVWWYEQGYQRNNELQYYTSNNGWQENGMFVIEAREETTVDGNGANQTTYDYTSSSIKTEGNYSWQYGRAQIRAKVPALAGMWPAIWTVGDAGEWPYNGECDIMEYYQNKILANCAVGSGQRWTAKWDGSNRTMASLEAVDPNWKNEFHIWTMQWDEDNVRLYCDNILMNTIPQSWLVNNGGYGGSPSEPFKQPHSLWLNLAVGGGGGGPVGGTSFPQRYYIDYWRIWEGATDNVAPTDIALTTNDVNEGLPVGTVVADLSATDADPAEVIRYALVAGAGDDDNALFSIPEFVSDNTLIGQLKTAAVLDYDNGATRSIRVRATDIEGATYEKVLILNIIPDPDIVVSSSSVEVLEGGTQTFDVKLRYLPTSNITVNVYRDSGDSDLSVQSGAALTFTPANGTTWQTVTLAAAEDADVSNGSATILCTDPSATFASATVTATEIENDNNSPIVDAGPDDQIPFSGGGATSPTAGADILLDASQDDGANLTWEDTLSLWDVTLDSGVTFISNAGSGLTGIASAYDFPGGSTHVGGQGESLQNMGLDTQPISLEIWFKPDQSASYPSNGQVLWETGGGTGLGIFYNDGFVEAAHDSNQGEISADVSSLTGEFIQVVVTYDTGTTTDNFNLYINGALAATGSRNDPDMCASDGAGLGRRGGSNTGGAGTGVANSDAFDGQIAIFRAYHNQILTAQEVQDNFDSVAGASVDYALDGTVTEPDGESYTVVWTQEAGPATAIFTNPNSVDTNVSLRAEGDFVFRLTADDGTSLPGYDEVTISVGAGSGNNLPVFTADPFSASDATEDVAYSGSIAGSATDADPGDTLTYAKVSGPAWLSVAGDGILSGTPTNVEVGVNAFTVSVTDSNSAPVEATLNITVNNTNDAPYWLSDPVDEVNATEDVAYASTLSDDAADIDAGASLSFAKVNGPAWLSVASNGDLSGTPTSGDVGANAFTVSVSDGIAGAVEVPLNIEVTNTNNAPVFTADPIAGSDATEDAAYSGTIAGSATDADPGDTLTYAKVSGPAWLSVAGDGTLFGTPTNGDVGANAFTVSVTDNIASPVQATLNITVINTNDVPVFTADPIAGANATEDAAYSGSIAGSATDDDAGATLTYAKVSGPAWLSVAGDGSLSGTPTIGDVGANAFTVSVSDGIAAAVQATLNITVDSSTPPSGDPVIYESFADDPGDSPDLLTGNAGGTGLTGNWGSDNRFAINPGSLSYGGLPTSGDSVQYIGTGGGGGRIGVSTNGDLASAGLLADNATLWFSIIVDFFDGGNDEFAFTLATDQPFTSTITNSGSGVGFYVDGTSNISAAIYNGGSRQTGNLTGNANFNGTTRLIVGQVVWGVDGVSDDTVTLYAPGTDLDITGTDFSTVSFDVTQSAFDTVGFWARNGDSDSYDEIRFGATLDDVLGTSSGGNSAPEWAANPFNKVDATEDAAYSVTLADDASDADAGDTLTFAKVSGPAWLSVAANGDLSGTPANDDVGANAFTVSVTDSVNPAVEATLNITVLNTNDDPVFTADPIAGSNATEDAAYADSIAGSATDVDAGDSLSYAKVGGPAWLSVAANGDLSGTPSNADVGVNAFTVSVDDGNGGSDTGTLNITVINTNDAPTWASNPVNETDATEDAAYSASLADNAADIDTGASLSFAKVSGPAWLSVASNGDLSGTPSNSEVGANAFTVSVSDGIASPVNATLNITVLNINNAPAFTVDPIPASDATEDTAYAGTLAGSATDADVGDILTYAKDSGPTWLSVAGDGTLSGTPSNDDVGSNAFTVSVNDGNGGNDTATFNITVINTNDAPVFIANPIAGANATEDEAYAGSIAGTATDDDAGATLTYVKVSGPAWLSVAGDGSLSGTPTSGDVGANAFTVSVSDGIAAPVQATLNITVDSAADTTAPNPDPMSFAVLPTPAGGGGGGTPGMAASPSAPTVDGADIASSGTESGSQPVWTDRPAAGQIFTTGLQAADLNAVTFLITNGPATRIFEVRVGSVSGTTFTEIYSESFSQTFDVGTSEYVTWTFTTPVSLAANTQYAVDVALSSSTNGWQTGMPSFSYTSDIYSGGQRYTSGSGGAGTSSMTLQSGDFNFHFDLSTGGGSSEDTITMTATTATDPSGVEYYFTETSGNPGGDDSGWQDSPEYTDTGLQAGTEYTYTVVARDKSTNQNTTAPSAPASTTTAGSPPGNGAPTWTTNPVNEVDATESVAYSASLDGAATDPESDLLAYSKVSGPAWLSVAANGDLSGTPADADKGANSFTVSVNDGNNPAVEATLNIIVIGTTSVPDVVGLAQATAESNIVSADLTVGNVTNRNDAVVPAGDVISQSPTSGNTVNEGTAVDLVVSLGPTQATVPSVVGQAQATAESNIVAANLVVGNVTSQYDAVVPAGDVISQNPSGGSTVDEGSSVDLVVSLGPPLTTVPNVVGLAQATAESNIVAANLMVGTVTQQSSETVPAGDVISQGLTAGSSVPEGSSVDLVVSSGPVAGINLVRTTVTGVTNTSWTTVALGQTYASPVIVATPIYPVGVYTPVVTRITNVTSTGFDMKLDRADGFTGSVSFDVSVIAVEEGVYTQANDGVTMEAVKFTSTSTAYGASNWVAESRILQNSYTNLVVVGQVMSYNDTNWSTFFSMGLTRQDPADAASFNVSKHVGQDPNTARLDETIGYIVLEAGSGTIDGVAYEAGLGADLVQCFGDSGTPYTYSLSGSLSTASAAALSQSGMDGNDGSWAVLSGSNPITPTSLSLHVAEDSLKDTRQKHTSEQVGYIVFE